MIHLHTFFKEFTEFLNKFQVVGLAIALVIGFSATQLVQSIVVDLISPLIGLVTPDTISLVSLEFTIGKSSFTYGHLISEGIHFLIVSLLVFIAYKQLKKFKFVGEVDASDIHKGIKDRKFASSL